MWRKRQGRRVSAWHDLCSFCWLICRKVLLSLSGRMGCKKGRRVGAGGAPRADGKIQKRWRREGARWPLHGEPTLSCRRLDSGNCTRPQIGINPYTQFFGSDFPLLTVTCECSGVTGGIFCIRGCQYEQFRAWPDRRHRHVAASWREIRVGRGIASSGQDHQQEADRP